MSRNQWVLVTGHSGGIGSAVTRFLLEAGYFVYGVGRSGPDSNDVGLNAYNLKHAAMDLANLKDIPGFLEFVNSEIGPLRGFVHCAGIDLVRPIHMTDADAFERLIRIHAIAPLMILGSLTRTNRITADFSSVLLSSLATHEGARGHVGYAAAKGAVSGSLRAVASELVPRGARVNVVTPGIVRTPMSEAWLSRLDERRREEIRALYPLGFGAPEDIAAIVRFLISDDSRWITGQEFIADGGRLIGK